MKHIIQNKKIKFSINRQFALIFIALMAATILLCWFLNNTFLEEYYIRNKATDLTNAYDVINAAANDGTISSEAFDVQLQGLCARYNIDILVVDVDSKTIKFTGKDPEASKIQLWDNLFIQDQPENSKENNNAIVETDKYRIKIVRDRRMNSENIEMWGNLDNGNMFLIRTALESIRDSVAISNRFLAYVGLISAVASGLFIWLISRRITKPILELADISEKMTHLDFDARYSGKSKNEIALLGENINILSETLEHTISELKTANTELTKDIQKKTEIDEMRKEFLSNVSHELKTPIALIQGYAEGLQEGINDDADSRDFYCSVICDEAAKMNTLVKKLLTLNQLEFGTDTITMERFDIIALIRNCTQATDILMKQNDIRVQLPNEEMMYVWGDEFKVEEVFTNYLSNAINHCAGNKLIDIRLEKIDGRIRTIVFNTGQPIPSDSISHVWEKFYKVDKARTRAYGGSGVGLSIVKAIMESMNQKYGVDNYENGVAFWFELDMQQTIEETVDK